MGHVRIIALIGYLCLTPLSHLLPKSRYCEAVGLWAKPSPDTGTFHGWQWQNGLLGMQSWAFVQEKIADKKNSDRCPICQSCWAARGWIKPAQSKISGKASCFSSSLFACLYSLNFHLAFSFFLSFSQKPLSLRAAKNTKHQHMTISYWKEKNQVEDN